MRLDRKWSRCHPASCILLGKGALNAEGFLKILNLSVMASAPSVLGNPISDHGGGVPKQLICLKQKRKIKMFNRKLPINPKTNTDDLNFAKKNRAKQNYVMAEPVYIKKIMQKSSNKEIAEYIGVTPSVLSTAIRENKTRKVNELAAKSIYDDMQQSDGKIFIAGFIDSECWGLIKPWLRDAEQDIKELTL